jgi:hypothetical protein
MSKTTIRVTNILPEQRISPSPSISRILIADEVRRTLLDTIVIFLGYAALIAGGPSDLDLRQDPYYSI